MDTAGLIEALGDPAAYPHPVAAIEVRQTHISAVFLAGPFAYKVKKPVAPGFLDFTTLDRRLHFCREEVRLNRRLAPDVYLGIVPVARGPAGLRVEGDGEVVEWAVKMRRLPDDATLLDRLRRGAVGPPLAEALARRLAAFHRGAEAGDRIAANGRFPAVAQTVADVFARAAPAVAADGRGVFDRVRALAADALARLRPLIDARAARGVPRDCHGDLHLDHVYSFPDRPPPGDLVVVDCIEFDERLRFIDPAADTAFAVMDFAYRGRRDLGRAFADTYFRAAGDADGPALLPLYTAYRAAVRGMVEGLLIGESEVPDEERNAARVRARAYWLLALTELETPARRPCLVLTAGLPGSGKSTLALALAADAGFELVRSDAVRKELTRLPADEPAPASVRESLYTDDATTRAYAECLRRAERILSAGRRALVDATFREERHRVAFVDAAVRAGVPAVILACEVSAKTARARLAARPGGASDADWSVYQRVVAAWDEPAEAVGRVYHRVSTEGPPERGRDAALGVLRGLGLYAD